MKIQVTRGDILKGNPGNPYSCAVALAIQRASNEAEVTVSADSVRLYYDDRFQIKRCPLPKLAQTFVHRFDNWGILRWLLRPMEFELSGELD